MSILNTGIGLYYFYTGITQLLIIIFNSLDNGAFHLKLNSSFSLSFILQHETYKAENPYPNIPAMKMVVYVKTAVHIQHTKQKIYTKCAHHLHTILLHAYIFCNVVQEWKERRKEIKNSSHGARGNFKGIRVPSQEMNAQQKKSLFMQILFLSFRCFFQAKSKLNRAPWILPVLRRNIFKESRYSACVCGLCGHIHFLRWSWSFRQTTKKMLGVPYRFACC